MSFIGWPWFGVTGWLLFGVSLLFGRWALSFQAQATKRELDRMAQVRNEAIQMRLELDMDSSKKK